MAKTPHKSSEHHHTAASHHHAAAHHHHQAAHHHDLGEHEEAQEHAEAAHNIARLPTSTRLRPISTLTSSVISRAWERRMAARLAVVSRWPGRFSCVV